MPAGERSDFFLSRRGSVAAVAREVTDVLTERGYTVVVQDYDFPLGSDFVEAMHEAIKNARDLIVLFTRDYENSPYTRKEFTSFEANQLQSDEERRMIILRCEDVPPLGLFAGSIYQDLFGVDDPAERKRRIIAAAEGNSLAQRPPPRQFVGAPPRIASFTGRADELDHLDAILIGGDKPPAITQAPLAQIGVGRAAVQGLGGVGKTSLAAEYAYRHRDLYAGVWWCPAESRIGLLTGLTGLAQHLGAAAVDEADVEKSAKAGLRRLAEQRATWLLVYDNVTSPDEIADLLPSAGARVLITSRFQDFSGWAEEVALDVLPPADAIAFLETRAGRHDEAGARTLAEALGRLPLALDHAAAYCRRTQTSFANYAAKAASLIDAAPRGAVYQGPVAATFGLAIDAAVATCPAGETLMAYLAHCAPERIPLTLLEGAIDDEAERIAALLALTEISLAKPDPFKDGTPAVTVHRLVQAVARVRARANGDSPAAAERVTRRLTAIYPNDGYYNPASWPLCEQLTPHLLARCEAQTANDAGDTESAELLDRAGSYFHGRAAYREAQPLSERALAILEKAVGPDHPDTAAALNNLALLLHAQGKLTASRPLNERALAIRERMLGPGHPDTATSLNNLAFVLHGQGDLAEARPLYERALAIRESALGSEDPNTAASLNNLGGLLQEQGDLAAARPLFERALAIREKALGPEHPDTAGSLNSLGFTLQAQGHLAAARPILERALTIREQALGPDHPRTARSLNNLADLLRAQGDLAAAQPLFERARAIYEKALGPQHPNTARVWSNNARLLLATSQPVEALASAEAALAVHDKALAPSHPWTKDSARIAAAALATLGRAAEAAALRARYGISVDG